MDNTRLFLFIALSFLGLLIWEAWQRDYHMPPPAATADRQSADLGPSSALGTDQTTMSPAPTETPESVPADGPPKAQTPTNMNIVAPSSERAEISVRTDVYDIRVDLNGGGISYAALREYPVSSQNRDQAFEFLADNDDRLFIHQGGLTGDGTTPDHRARFSASQEAFSLGDNDQELVVALAWRRDDGLAIDKVLTFRRGSYVVDIAYRIENGSAEPWHGRLYEQLQRAKPKSKRTLLYTFTGAALSTPEQRYEKFDYDDLADAPLDANVSNGWVGVLEHYFVSALVPRPQDEHHYYSKIVDSNRYLVGHYGPALVVEPGQKATLESKLFIGPKRQDILPTVAPGLDFAVDYGVLWFIAEPLFHGLQFIRDLTGNWGWAIVILTIILKLIFYPLSAAGYRSMAKMRKVQPRMMAIKERYGSDRARMNQAMMELYKEERINPLGGCLPILVQIPVFIALYWVLLESVELRQVPFTLWLTDLTAKDPYFVLPLIMGVSMWVQQKLNPAPMDPIQQKVMQILPFVFTVFFAFFPSGLVLYWVVNNILSILQQWRITQVIEKGAT